ncbi:MAG TPA: GNAT family N-acetyltransferase [Longimicrobiaceae bacterium]|nr:GNAT family N-acetyltransferase [Longimicrobiaceae bacterium]
MTKTRNDAHSRDDLSPSTESPSSGPSSAGGTLVTARLELVPATAEILRAELDDRARFAELLDAHVPAEWPPELYERENTEHALAAAEAKGGSPPWPMYYIVERAAEGGRRLVGISGFNTEPRDGAVELGYGLVAAAQGRGYATEAVRAMIGRAFADPSVHTVIGETLPDLAASIRVMERCRFVPVAESSAPGIVRFALRREGPPPRLA